MSIKRFFHLLKFIAYEFWPVLILTICMFVVMFYFDAQHKAKRAECQHRGGALIEEQCVRAGLIELRH